MGHDIRQYESYSEAYEDALDFICHELEASDFEEAKRRLYKATECGAWMEIKDDRLRIGSIVEGCDFDAPTRELMFPLTFENFWDAIAGVESDADAIWEWANEVRPYTGKTDAEMGLDWPGGRG